MILGGIGRYFSCIWRSCGVGEPTWRFRYLGLLYVGVSGYSGCSFIEMYSQRAECILESLVVQAPPRCGDSDQGGCVGEWMVPRCYGINNSEKGLHITKKT